MKKMILILTGVLFFTSCGSRLSCDSRKTQKTVLRMYKTEITAQLAYQRFYDKKLYQLNSYLGRQVAALAYLMGQKTKSVAQIEKEALDDLRDLANGKKLDKEKMQKYKPYMHYADSIMELGHIHLENIVTSSTNPKVKKYSCEALLVFDPSMHLKNFNVRYLVQKDSQGKTVVTIYY